MTLMFTTSLFVESEVVRGKRERCACLLAINRPINSAAPIELGWIIVSSQKVVAPRPKEISRSARNDSWKAVVISTEGRDLYMPPAFVNLLLQYRRRSGFCYTLYLI